MRAYLLLCIGAFGLCLAEPSTATSVRYDVQIDTSSFAGTMGSLDLNFNPGPSSTEAATLQISDLSTDGTVAGSPQVVGSVSGTLRSGLTFTNATALNDYFDGFTFGSSLALTATLSGPALTVPGGSSGSTFAFSMFSDPGGTVPVLTSDTQDGFAFLIDVNVDGTTSITNYSSQTSVVPVSTVAEPSGLMLVVAGLAGVIGQAMRRRKLRL